MDGRWDSLRRMTDPLSWLKDALMYWGLENFCRRYYGTYYGIVIDNKDPEGRCRVRAICPAIKMTEEDDVPDEYWIMPDLPGMGTDGSGQMTGMFWPPDEGTNICIKFRFGDLRYPVYDGGFITTGNVSDTFESSNAYKRGFRTKTGHFVKFDDDPSNLSVLITKGDGSGGPSPMFISMDKDGNMQISNEIGSQIYMDAVNKETTIYNSDGASSPSATSLLKLGDDSIMLSTKSGGAIQIDGKDVSITGDNVLANCNRQFYANAGSVKLGANAAEPAVRGFKLMQWALLHMHPTAAPFSPTAGSVLPLIMMNELSDKVMVG